MPRRRLLWMSLGLLVLAALIPFLFRALIVAHYSRALYTVETVPAYPAALVMGAGLWWDGTPSPVLRNRVHTAIALYQAGKVDRLIMSGDANAPEGDETAVMRRLALEAGVPDSAILIDGFGVRTYDSCVRARNVYGESRVIVVTQRFHQARSLYLCDGIGLESVGVPPAEERMTLRLQVEREIREVFATALAWWDITDTDWLQ